MSTETNKRRPTGKQIVFVMIVSVIWCISVWILKHPDAGIRAFKRSPLDSIASAAGSVVIPVGLSFVISLFIESKYPGSLIKKWIICNIVLMLLFTPLIWQRPFGFSP